MTDTRPEIAFFLPNLQGGGAEKVMVNLANAFSTRGTTVDFVLGKAEGPNLEKLYPAINVVDLGTSNVFGWLEPMIRYLKRSKPRIVLSGLHHANLTTIMAKNLSGVDSQIIVTVHGQLSQDVGNSRKKLAKAIPFLVQKLYPKTNRIICVSQGVADELINRYGLPEHKIQVIYNPVLTDDIFEKAEEPIDHPWFQLDQPPVILGVGRLAPQKNFETLIKAFSLVRKKVEAKLVILGEGPERGKLESLVEELGLNDDVRMPGFVESPYKYMKHSNVFVLSSRWEGFGNVIVEALALGVPVVSTDCPSGPAEILENGKWGRLVPVGDPKALAEAILEAMNDERGKGIERAKEFTLEKIASQYLELVQSIL